MEKILMYKIISDGTSNDTQVINKETGEILQNITSILIKPTERGFKLVDIVITLPISETEIDIEGEVIFQPGIRAEDKTPQPAPTQRCDRCNAPGATSREFILKNYCDPCFELFTKHREKKVVEALRDFQF